MNTSILIRHSGIWVNELQYENYKIDGIVVGDSISFSNLKAAIAAELDIDVSRKEIEIRYIVEGNSCPMKLKNDMSVKLYFEMKKTSLDFQYIHYVLTQLRRIVVLYITLMEEVEK